jgi:hypothetical protein
LCGIHLTGEEELTARGVLADRIGSIVDPVAVQLAHVERLELLDRVAARTHPQRLFDHGEQVDEHVGAQQVVHRVLPHTVAGGEREQMRALVGRVVVDVHVGVARATLRDVVEEVEKRLPFLGERVRPERQEPLRRLDQPKQVVDTPLLAAVFAVERVALEVEENVALVGPGQCGESGRVNDLERGGLRARGGQLHACLLAQSGHGRFGQTHNGPGGCRESIDREDPRLSQLLALGQLDAGDEQHVAVRVDLLGARGTATARRVARVAPLCGRVGGYPLVDEPLQSRATLAVHREDVAQAVGTRAAVSEQEIHVGPEGNPERGELVTVGSQLQQGGDLLAAGELGVVHLVLPCLVQQEEIGKPEKPAVEERRLEQRVCTRTQRGLGFGGRPGQLAHGRALELHYRPRLLELLERPQFVRVTQGARAAEHRVGFFGHLGDTAQLAVELAHQCPLAVRGRGQIAGAVDNDGRGRGGCCGVAVKKEQWGPPGGSLQR